MNACIFSGRLTRDLEMRQTQSGKPVANFGLAVDAGKKNADGSKAVDFFNCVAWERTAEVMAQYCRKGDQVLVQAEAHVRTWTDKAGTERKEVEFTVYRFDFGAKAKGNEQGAPRGEYDSNPQGRPGYTGTAPRSAPASMPGGYTRPAAPAPRPGGAWPRPGEPAYLRKPAAQAPDDPFDDLPDNFQPPAPGDDEVPF